MVARQFTLPRRAVLGGAVSVLLAPSALALTGCASKSRGDSGPLAMVAATIDDHSYARPQEARVSHVDLDLTADFATKTLKGTAALTLQTEPNAKQVILDVKWLSIESVTDASGSPLTFTLGAFNPDLGQPLTIELPQGAQKVVIRYATTDKTTALQWLEPSQTAGKAQPYLFSQGQEIHTRTWIPTQDSPAVRQTYSARIVAPAALKAVMSAQMLTPEGEAVPDQPGLKAYRFKMDEAIPPYLIAIAIGDIGFKSTGSRTGVYAEPSVLSGAAEELSDLEKLVTAAEKIYGPYRWGRYDVLIMPPSFPFGGMENPRLTFATPTILSGDKSLVSLIAHELAHSWSGNLVTNATWEDFWLNEGFTVYFENRIMEQVYGVERADMLKVLGFNDLKDTLEGFKDNPNFAKLHPDLKGIHPDDYFSEIPYEKGAAFLRMLEAHFGRRKLDGYLKSYFNRYAFQSMTTEAFLADLREHLLNNDAQLEKTLMINAWLYEPGLPSNVVVPTSPVFDQVTQQVTAFAAGAEAKTLQVAGWVTQQWQFFLSTLPDSIDLERLANLDAAFSFTQTHNSEILFQWLLWAIKRHYEPAMPALEAFVTGQGRRKFVLPLFRTLMAQPGWGEEMARRVYAVARPGYHEVSRRSIDEVVKPKA